MARLAGRFGLTPRYRAQVRYGHGPDWHCPADIRGLSPDPYRFLTVGPGLSQLFPAHVLTSEANSGEQYVSEIYGSGGYDSGRDHDPGPVQQRDTPREWHDRSADPGYGTPEYAQQIYERGDFDPHDDSTWGFTRADAHRWAEHDTADDTQQAAGDGGSARDRQGDGTAGRLRADQLDGHDTDIHDAYPDAGNDARGNTPEIAWRNQGNPDSPNGWGSYLREHQDATPVTTRTTAAHASRMTCGATSTPTTTACTAPANSPARHRARP